MTRRALWTLAAFQMVAWGTVYYGFAVWLVPIAREFGWSTRFMTAAFSAALAACGLAALPLARWIDRGLERAVLLAGAAAASSLLLLATAVRTRLEFFLVAIVLGASMAAVLYEPAFALVTRRAAAPARALLLLTTVAGLASIVVAPFVAQIVEAYGWRAAAAVSSMLLLAAAAALAATHADWQPFVPIACEAAPRRLIDGTLLLFTCAIALSTFSAVGVTAHALPLVATTGIAIADGVRILSALGVGQIVGRFLYPALRAHLSSRTITVISMLAHAAGLLCLRPALLPSIAGAALIGVANGLITLARATVPAELYGVQTYARTSSVIALGVAAARAAAPFGFELLRAQLGGYLRVFGALAAALAMTAALCGRAWRSSGEKM